MPEFFSFILHRDILPQERLILSSTLWPITNSPNASKRDVLEIQTMAMPYQDINVVRKMLCPVRLLTNEKDCS